VNSAATLNDGSWELQLLERHQSTLRTLNISETARLRAITNPSPSPNMVSDQELEQSTAQLADFRATNEKHHTTLTEVLEKYSSLMQDYQRLRSDLEEERDSREKYKQLAKGQERNPFVLVLVDGDGYVFDDDLISNGGEGGQRAAQLLNDAVRSSLRSRGLDHCRIMVRVYANVSGLSKALSKVKLAGPEKRSITPFMASFNRSNDLFDFVDAGDLKENADFKIRAMFRQFAENAQCKQIYFAACHDVGYVSELTPYVGNRDRITLVRTPAFHREFMKLNMRTEDFPNVFRTHLLDTTQVPASTTKSTQPLVNRPLGNQTNMASPASDTAQVCSFFQKGLCKYGNGCKFKHVKLNANGHTSNTSLSDVKNWRQGSSGDQPFSMPQLSKNDNDFMAGNSDSQVDLNQAQIDFATKLPQAENIPAGQIPVNKDSHRLDQYISPPGDKSEFNARTAKKKLCNSYHINGICPNGDACTYDHRPASTAVLNCLKQVVFNNPCPRRGACRSLTCLYGHACQKADCKYRGGHVYCKFPPQVHYQDMALARFVPRLSKHTNNAGAADEHNRSASTSGKGSISPTAVSPPLSTVDGEVEEGNGEGALLTFSDDEASVD